MRLSVPRAWIRHAVPNLQFTPPQSIKPGDCASLRWPIQTETTSVSACQKGSCNRAQHRFIRGIKEWEQAIFQLCHPERSCRSRSGRQRSRRTPCYWRLAIPLRGILTVHAASWERLYVPEVTHASRGSFDFAQDDRVIDAFETLRTLP